MKAHRKVERTRALILKTKNAPGRQQGEKPGDEPIDLGEMQHLRQSDKTRRPIHFSRIRRPAEEMENRIEATADQQRHRPGNGSSEAAKNSSSKKQFFKKSDGKCASRRTE